MQDSSEQKQKAFAELLKKHRQEMEAYWQQQEATEERLARFRQRQQALKVIMNAIRAARQWRIQHQQAFEQERQAWREAHKFLPPIDKWCNAFYKR